MLEIGMHEVTKNFGFSNVLAGVNLDIMTGDRIALVGRNGTGKSTILKIIAGEEPPTSGTVNIRRGATVGYLEQIPQLLDQHTSTKDVLMFPFAHLEPIERRMRKLEADMATAGPEALEVLMRQYAHQQSLFEAQGGYDLEEQFSRISKGFGLTPLLDRPFNVLSGGQKTIVMLACTLLHQPDILLLDEPTNHLDVKTLEWFEDTLQKYRGTIIMVSHDRYFLDRVARKTVILERGQCKLYHGNYSASQEEREKELLLEFEQYKNEQRKVAAMKAAIKRFRDWGDRGNNEDLYAKAKMIERRLEKMELLDRPQLEKQGIPIAFSGGRTAKEVLKLEDYDLSIGTLALLRDVSVKLLYQEKVCLLGDNGTGKTTLIRAILESREAPGDGIFVAPSTKIGYIPQEIRFSDDKLSVLEAFRDEHPCPQGEARNILAKYFFYGEHVFKRVSALSGGEKVLLKLAILMQREINFLILDEPTNHIDVHTRELLEEALLGFGGTLLFVSHDRYFIQKIATCIWEIEDAQIERYADDYETYRAFKRLLDA